MTDVSATTPTDGGPVAAADAAADEDTSATEPDSEDPTGTVERGTLDDPARDTLSEPEPAEADETPAAEGDPEEGAEPS